MPGRNERSPAVPEALTMNNADPPPPRGGRTVQVLDSRDELPGQRDRGFEPGMMESALTWAANAWVNAISYHAITPHVIVDTPLVVKVFGIA